MDSAKKEALRDDGTSHLAEPKSYGPLAGAKILGLGVDAKSTSIRLTVDDGTLVTFVVGGDCCSISWIEHYDIPPNIAGAVISWVRATQIEGRQCGYPHHRNEGAFDAYHGVCKFYDLRIATNRGEAVFEFRNDSNGYYGATICVEVE